MTDTHQSRPNMQGWFGAGSRRLWRCKGWLIFSQVPAIIALTALHYEMTLYTVSASGDYIVLLAFGMLMCHSWLCPVFAWAAVLEDDIGSVNWWSAFWRSMGAGVLALLIYTVGIFFAVIPTLFFIGVFMFKYPLILDHGFGVWRAITQSFVIMTDHTPHAWWAVLAGWVGWFVVFLLVLQVDFHLVDITLDRPWWPWIHSAASAALCLVSALVIAYMAEIYVRVRHLA